MEQPSALCGREDEETSINIEIDLNRLVPDSHPAALLIA